MFWLFWNSINAVSISRLRALLVDGLWNWLSKSSTADNGSGGVTCKKKHWFCYSDNMKRSLNLILTWYCWQAESRERSIEARHWHTKWLVGLEKTQKKEFDCSVDAKIMRFYLAYENVSDFFFILAKSTASNMLNCRC